MKNTEKWTKTLNEIFNLSKDVQTNIEVKELQNRVIRRQNIMYKPNNSESEDISISVNNVSLVLFGDNLGDYMETFFKKRKRLNVVPMCFLVQLYNEQMQIKNEEVDSDSVIPYELKSFWKMEKAEDLAGDLNKVIWKQQLVLQNIYDKYESPEHRQKVAEALELVNSLKILPPKGGKVEIHFSELKFIVNTKNVKLNIIPLCKLLVKYYVQFIDCISNTCESFEDMRTERMLRSLENSMQNFMERYFTSQINW